MGITGTGGHRTRQRLRDHVFQIEPFGIFMEFYGYRGTTSQGRAGHAPWLRQSGPGGGWRLPLPRGLPLRHRLHPPGPATARLGCGGGGPPPRSPVLGSTVRTPSSMPQEPPLLSHDRRAARHRGLRGRGRCAAPGHPGHGLISLSQFSPPPPPLFPLPPLPTLQQQISLLPQIFRRCCFRPSRSRLCHSCHLLRCIRCHFCSRYCCSSADGIVAGQQVCFRRRRRRRRRQLCLLQATFLLKKTRHTYTPSLLAPRVLSHMPTPSQLYFSLPASIPRVSLQRAFNLEAPGAEHDIHLTLHTLSVY